MSDLLEVKVGVPQVDNPDQTAKGKPVVRRGRKARGLHMEVETAQPPDQPTEERIQWLSSQSSFGSGLRWPWQRQCACCSSRARCPLAPPPRRSPASTSSR